MPNKSPKMSRTPTSKPLVDREALARLAYELYLRRGGEHGHDVEDWLEAERILMEKISRSNGRRSRSHPMRRLEDQFGAR